MKKIMTSLAMMSVVASPTLSLINNNQTLINSNYQVKDNFNNPMVSQTLLPNTPVFGAEAATSSNGTIYAGTTGNGLYVSKDGLDFTPISFFNNLGVSNIYIDKQNNIFVSTQNGIFESTDNGGTFNLLTSQFSGSSAIVSSVANINNNLFVISNFQVYKSTDSGKNFQLITSIPQSSVSTILVTPNGALIFSGVRIYTSTDYVNFNLVNLAPPDLMGSSSSLAPNGDVYIIGQTFLGNSSYSLYSLSADSNYQTVKTIISQSAMNLSGNFIFYSQNIIYLTNLNDKVLEINLTTGVTKNLGKILPYFSGVDNLSVINNSVYAATDAGINIIDAPYQLVKFSLDYTISANNTFQFTNEQNLDLNWKFLSSVTCNGQAVSSQTTKLTVAKGTTDNLSFQLKGQYKSFASIFGGDNNTGIVNYSFTVTS